MSASPRPGAEERRGSATAQREAALAKADERWASATAHREAALAKADERRASASARREAALAKRAQHAVDTRPRPRLKVQSPPAPTPVSQAQAILDGLEPYGSAYRMHGHVFVVNSAVHKVHCDAFLCPGYAPQSLVSGPILQQWSELLAGWPQVDSSAMSWMHIPFCGPLPGFERDSLFTELALDRDRNLMTWPDLPQVAALKKWKQRDGSPAELPRPIFTNVNVIVSNLGVDSSIKDIKEQRALEGCEGLMASVRQFVAAALRPLPGQIDPPTPLARRHRLLLAVPVVGTGGGGFTNATGLILKRLLEVLEEEASPRADRAPFDAVVVCADAATYCMAQTIRRQQLQPTFGALLPPPRRTEAAELAGLVAAGRLSLFMGAGSSMAAGLPGWWDLLHSVEDELNFESSGRVGTPRSVGASVGWDPLEGARVLHERTEAQARACSEVHRTAPVAVTVAAAAIAAAAAHRALPVASVSKCVVAGAAAACLAEACRRSWPWRALGPAAPAGPGARRSLKERIAALVSEGRQTFSLVSALLAPLPVKSIITTNYDTLIEQSCECVDVSAPLEDRPFASRKLSVLPYRPASAAQRWLLKMHGCSSVPEDIVITAADYKSYELGRMKALGSLVQANLMTSHFLFVGFSMSDPNYLRLISEVRLALSPRSNGGGGDSGGSCDGGAGAVLSSRLVDRGIATRLAVDSWPEQPTSSAGGVGYVNTIYMHPDSEDSSRAVGTFGANRVSEAARALEVFLDFVALLAASSLGSSPFLFDARFAHLLSSDDRALSDALLKAYTNLSPQARDTAGGKQLATLLRSMGHSMQFPIG